GPLALRVPPRGAVTPFLKGLLFAQDIDEDNTVDDERDTDEEWTVELALPLERLAPVKEGGYQMRISRGDRPKDGIERCGAWAGVLALDAQRQREVGRY